MENNNSKSNKITKADWITFIGYSLFTALSLVGLSFSLSWQFAAVVTVLLMLVTIFAQWLLIKLKKVEGHFVAFRIVEYFSLVIYIGIMLLFVDMPMARSLSVIFLNKDYYKEYALKDLDDVSKQLRAYERQEQDAITQCKNSLTTFAYTSSSEFNSTAAEYARLYLGTANFYTQTNVTNFYKEILYSKFLRNFDDYSVEINNRVNNLRSCVEDNWEFNSSSLSAAIGRKSVESLRAEVGRYLTELSQSAHTDDDGNEHAYKFEFYRADNGKIDVRNIEEMKYDYSFRPGRLAAAVGRIKSPLQIGASGIIISLIINLFMVFTYIMAFRSTKVAIRKHYRRNRMDIGGIEL